MRKSSAPLPTGYIQKRKIPSFSLLFSFKYFDDSDPELCPSVFHESYTHALMQRLKDLSSWTIQEFITKRHKSIRNHSHNWSETIRPKGFTHLNEQLQNYPGWQFVISANKHGRVHGIIIDHVFYVVWLDQNHKLYS